MRAVLLDARRGEVYAAVYDANLRVVVPEAVIALPVWLAGLPDAELEFIAPDFAPFRAALSGTRFVDAPVLTAPRALAGTVARIAWSEWQRGEAQDPAAVDANYVRRSDAELFWKGQQ